MRHDIQVYKEKDKQIEESFSHHPSARHAFSVVSARKSARDYSSGGDRNHGHRRSMEESQFSQQQQNGSPDLGKRGERNLRTSQVKYRKPNGYDLFAKNGFLIYLSDISNLLSVRQPSKREVERYLSRDPHFLNEKELTFEKSFLEEFDQLKKENLGQNPNYNT